MLGQTTTDNPWDPAQPATESAPDPWSTDELTSARAYFQNYMDARGGMGTYGNVDDPIRAYQSARTQGMAHDPALQNALSTLGWNNVPLMNQPGPAPGPMTSGGPGGGGGGAPAPNVGGLIQPFGQSFAPPAATPYPNAPTFTPPSMNDAANDDGYQFSLNQGKKNLESWLSAHGTFNDSSAAEALQQYGQGSAATQYNNVWGRQYQAYQGALQPWQTNVATIQHDNDTGWQNAFNAWLQNWNVFRDQRDSTFNHQYQIATA